MTGVGQCLKAGFGNHGVTFFAATECPFLSAFERVADLFEDVFLILHQGEGEILFVAITPQIRRVRRSGRRARAGFVVRRSECGVGQMGKIPP